MKAHFVTGYSIRKNSSRCWAWFKSIRTARNFIKKDSEYIYECEFEYCVLESIPEGPMQCMNKEEWYKYDKKKEKYFKVDKPKEIKEIINFSIG